MASTPFEAYRTALRSLPLSVVWRGHGTAIFLEFGTLSQRNRRDGSPANAQGDYTIMIEWSWRIENENAILCGSWSDEKGWDDIFGSLVGRRVEDVALYGRLPELSISLSGGLHVCSFMTADGQPAWTIFAQPTDGQNIGTLSVENGKVIEGTDTEQQ